MQGDKAVIVHPFVHSMQLFNVIMYIHSGNCIHRDLKVLNIVPCGNIWFSACNRASHIRHHNLATWIGFFTQLRENILTNAHRQTLTPDTKLPTKF